MTGPEERLREALTAQAAAVEPEPLALDAIRRRIAARRRRSWRLAALCVPAVATAAAVAVGLATCAPPRPDAVRPPGTSVAPDTRAPDSVTPGPSAQPPSGSDTASPTGAGQRVSVPVYYVGTVRAGSLGDRRVLYREFHQLVVTVDTPTAKARAAVAEMLTAGSAVDPDYSTYWPAGVGVRSVTVAGDTATVDLTGVPASGPPDSAVAARSVDQLVFTATAAGSARVVRLLVDGAPRPTLWGVRTDAPLERRPLSEVQAPLWLIEPAAGATVSRSVSVHIAGIVFEATARLRVRNSSGAVVDDRQVTLSGAGPELGELRLTLTLAPGRYTIEVYANSAEDGSEQFHDNHEVTVR